MKPRHSIGIELDAALTIANLPMAAGVDSAAESVVSGDAFDGHPIGVFDGDNAETRAGRAATIYTSGPVVQVQAGGALTAGTDYYTTLDSNGHHVKWEAETGKKICGIWIPANSELGASANAADGDIIDVVLVPALPRSLSGVATITAGNNSVAVAVDAAFNGKTVVVSPSGGFDATATTFHGAVAAGSLTITANANATADTDVAYIIAEAD